MKYYLISLSIFFIATFFGQAQDNPNHQPQLYNYQIVVKQFVPELIDTAMENYFSKKKGSQNEIAGRDSFKILFKGKADWEKSKLLEFLNTHSWRTLSKDYCEVLIDKYKSLEVSIVDEQSAKTAIDSLAKYNPKKYQYYSPKAIDIASNYMKKMPQTESPRKKPKDEGDKPIEKEGVPPAPTQTTLSYILNVLLFLLSSSTVILFVLLHKANKKVEQLYSKLKDASKSSDLISKRDYNELLKLYKNLEEEHSKLKILFKSQSLKKDDNLTKPNFNKEESENKKELDDKNEVNKEDENKSESDEVKSAVNPSKQFSPEYFFFDEFNSGIFKEKAKSEAHKCVYKISTTADSNDIIELLVDKISMTNYIINKSIYLPEYICSIKYISGGIQTKIQNINPGKVRLENGEWRIQEKIKLEIL
jgi:hypothetical protein